MAEHVFAASGRFTYLICLAALMASTGTIFPSSASAQPVVTVSPPTPIFPDPVSGSQSSSRLITDGRGTLLARWRIHESERVWSYWDARSTDNGKTWSNARRLDDINAAAHYRGRAQTLLAVWSSTDDLGGTIGDDRDVLFARSDDFGLTWSQPAPLNANASGASEDASLWDISTDRLGTWIAIWVTRTTERVIHAARSDDDGRTWSEPTPLGTGHRPTHLVTDGSGNWLAAWSTAHIGYGGDQDVFFVRSADNGATWTEPAPLNSDAATDDDGTDDNLLLLKSDGDTWLAVWIHHEPFAHFVGYYSIEVARSIDRGETWTDFASMTTRIGFHDPIERPLLDTDGRGTWLLAWSSSDRWDEELQIRRSEYAISVSTDDGGTWSEPKIMHRVFHEAVTPHRTITHQLLTDRRGNWVVRWTTHDESGGTLGMDSDAFLHVSTDNGKTWSLTVPPKGFGEMAADENGHWVVLGSIEGRVVASRFALPDCNGNGLPDECDIDAGLSEDCNANGIPDDCDLSSGTSQDANANAIPDECESAPPAAGGIDPCAPLALAAIVLLLAGLTLRPAHSRRGDAAAED